RAQRDDRPRPPVGRALHRGRAPAERARPRAADRHGLLRHLYRPALRRLPVLRRVGRVPVPRLGPDRRQRHPGRAVRARVHGPVTGLLVPLGIGRGDVVAAVGAGGKTTLVYALAAEAQAQGLSVLVTTTTHMGTLPEAK